MWDTDEQPRKTRRYYEQAADAHGTQERYRMLGSSSLLLVALFLSPLTVS